MKKLSQFSWIIISLVGFLLFVLFFYVIVTSATRVTLSTPLYFFLIVVIDLVATGFISGAMHSIARYQVTAANKSLYVAGPAVIFFIILYLGYQYRPENKKIPITLSVLFSGPEGPNELITNGTVSIRIGEFSAAKKINEEGTALFTGISPEYHGKRMDLSIAVPGYYLASAKQFELSDSTDYTNLHITLSKKEDTTSIQGRVLALPERDGIAGASIRFQGMDQVIITDSSGNFTALLPIKSGAEIRVIVWKGKRELYNSLRTITDKDFLSIATNH
ncbi:MAG: hypothetical protein ACOH2A_00285 [Sphingobacteriaceae bacterium]